MESIFNDAVSPPGTMATSVNTRAIDIEHRDGGAASGLETARAQLIEPGQYLVFSESEAVQVTQLAREWTRIGRSMAADIRFDDPTVSRRHALIVRQPDGVRVLDDRSLNGVFVNGERVEWRALADGDEIVVGRYRLLFADVPGVALGASAGIAVGDFGV